MESYGTLTIEENGTKRSVSIVDYVQCKYKDNRVISVSKTEEDTYVITVENTVSSGRNPQCTMHLTKDSFVGFLKDAFIAGAEWQSQLVDVHTDNSAVIERLQGELNKYQWHDLMVDPNDLPNKDTKYIIAQYTNGYVNTMSYQMLLEAICYKEVIKWKYIE